MPPDDRQRIEHVLAASRNAVRFLGAMDEVALGASELHLHAIKSCFAEIGEAARHITPTGRAAIGDLPWRQIVGMRNIVIHVYWGIDLRQVVKTIRDDLPP
ncbi:MAG: DUF86 domain-containing protein [Phycisphaeraceae bacterium]|nr:DUF86 domain-containing protein [Phycisphaeraceae bacterium]